MPRARSTALAITGVGSNLVAPQGSAALGLILGVSGAWRSATITIDPGLGGALQSIRDSLRARSGPSPARRQRLGRRPTRIAKDREKLELTSTRYYNQLLTTFTAMEQPGLGVQGDAILSRAADQDVDQRQTTDVGAAFRVRGV